VMEEAARFILNDANLVTTAKHLRHDLDRTLSELTGLTAWRDTPRDVGTTIKTSREATRDSVADVVIAAGKRLSEALRAIEEYGKTLGASAGELPTQIAQLRYRGYELERILNLAMGSTRQRQWRLCVLISEELCPQQDWRGVAEAAIAGGADAIQLREKNLDDRQLLQRAEELVKLARTAGTGEPGGAARPAVIVNDRPDIALLAGADGVHLGQNDLPCAEVRRLVGRQLLIGVSTANIEQARQARHDGADYCGVGSMFPTTTTPKKVIPGPAYLRDFLAWRQCPHLAIGGIGLDNISQLVEVGVVGIAVSSCISVSYNPKAVCRQLLEALGDQPDQANTQLAHKPTNV
jgi:thiamine-phosphate pyrophosphorylase